MDLAPVQRDELSAGFFDAAAAGRLAVRQCENGHYLPPSLGYMGASLRCPECQSPNIDWVTASGDATLVTWTVAHSKDGSTKIAGVVELAEGPWMSVPIGVETDAGLAARTAMRATFVPSDGGEVVPVFVPA
jgi:uncharacterized OB-fold protein